MNKYDFSMGSLNVRGMNNTVKRRGIFEWAKKKKFDILMLQECYCSEENITEWSDEWGGTCLFAHGTKHSKGTMIIFKAGFDVEIISHTSDTEGRYIIAKTLIQGESFTLVNVYAPNTMRDKQTFFSQLNAKLETENITVDDNILTAGDWNTIQNGVLDKKGGRELNADTVTTSMTELLGQLNLIDIWRIQNPDLKRFTFRQKTPLIQSRLDYFMIGNKLQDIIDSTDIIPSIWSDHSAVVLNVKHLPAAVRGSSHWKFNALLTEDKLFSNTLCHKVADWQQEYEHINDRRILWELIKYEIRKFTMSYCSQRKLNMNNHLNVLQKELTELEVQLATDHNNDTMLRICEIKAQIKEREEEQIKGAILRSKVRWAEEGEQSTKFFFGLEKQNYIKKHVRKLKLDNGTTTTDPKKINSEMRLFYKNLYKSHSNNECSDDFFSSDSIPTLSEFEKTACDRPLTKDECFKTLKTFKKNKSPGNDGLTYEFYAKFWIIVADFLIDSYKHSFEENELSSSQRQAIITLIDKKEKDRNFLKNWRPISLMNLDYKILSKTISQRIQHLLPRLIHYNQCGFVEGRYIGDAIRSIQDVMEYAKIKNLSGILLFIDFEKAFDTIEWKFLWKMF